MVLDKLVFLQRDAEVFTGCFDERVFGGNRVVRGG
jgi:hypothetical protein